MAPLLSKSQAFLARTGSRMRPMTRAFALGLFLTPLTLVAQEEPGEPVAKDRYRVELLFFTPRATPEPEFLNGVFAPAIPLGAEMLYGEKPQAAGDDSVREGTTQIAEDSSAESVRNPVSDFSHTLLPPAQLHLAQARDRLRNSGRYNVQFLVGWEEAFPPGHKTPPLVVRVGPTDDGYADIEGIIQIERQRYLHVNAQFYDLDLTANRSGAEADAPRLLLEVLDTEAPDVLLLESQTAPEDGKTEAQAPPVDTLMRETRRMRSGKLHLLDAPTMGLLVYFHPLD